MKSWLLRTLYVTVHVGCSLLAFAGAIRAQDLPADVQALLDQRVSVAAKFVPQTARAGEVVTLEITATIEPGWHLYGASEEVPPALDVTEAKGLVPHGAFVVPPGTEHENFGEIHHWILDAGVFKQQFVVPPEAKPGELEPTGDFVYIACTEEKCDPDAKAAWSAKLAIEAGAARAEFLPEQAASDQAPPPAVSNELANVGMLEFLLLAIGGALFALVMPCTYPMIPITMSFFTKQADQRGGKVLPLALTYGCGIILIFAAIGLATGLAGESFDIQAVAFHWITNTIVTIAFFVFALALLGLINLQPPRFLMNAAGRASTKGGYLGVFLMGVALVITSFTCTAPFVGSVLALGVTKGAGIVTLGMAVFGLVMAIPFVALALMPGKLNALPRSGEWMNTLKVTLGFVELAAALKFLSNIDIALEWRWLSRELFLSIWAGIFFLTAMFLLGQIKLKGESGEIGPGRLVAALFFVFLTAYSVYGALGNRLDGKIMAAMAPPYSNRLWTDGGGGSERTSRALVIDDYDEARRLALVENKKLFVNFTGDL